MKRCHWSAAFRKSSTHSNRDFGMFLLITFTLYSWFSINHYEYYFIRALLFCSHIFLNTIFYYEYWCYTIAYFIFGRKIRSCFHLINKACTFPWLPSGSWRILNISWRLPASFSFHHYTGFLRVNKAKEFTSRILWISNDENFSTFSKYPLIR